MRSKLALPGTIVYVAGIGVELSVNSSWRSFINSLVDLLNCEGGRNVEFFSEAENAMLWSKNNNRRETEMIFLTDLKLF